MQVVILCGGQGTRLREETEFRPKPLVEIGGRPILWHLMRMYAHHGHKDFVLCLGYRGTMIKEYFLNYDALNNDFVVNLGGERAIEFPKGHDEQNYRVALVDTGLTTMTGGRLARIRPFIKDDTFMLTYGDGLANVDVNALLAFHRAHGRIGTVTTVKPQSRFGSLDLDDSRRVTHFAEKPMTDGAISAGYFVFNSAIFDYLGGDDCTLEQEPLERLAADGELMAYTHDGFWQAMDTYRDYLALN